MITNKQQSGFSLVETLVAITILLIVIVGPLSIITAASNSTLFASDQVTAFLLAQEGAELAQKARDDLVLAKFNNAAAADPWTTFTNTNGTYARCYVPAGCGLEISTDTSAGLLGIIRNCSISGTCLLYYSADESIRSRYTHTSSGNTPTIFTRTVNFENITTEEVRVISKVEWFSGVTRSKREIKVETYLFDVYGN